MIHCHPTEIITFNVPQTSRIPEYRICVITQGSECIAHCYRSNPDT